MILAGIAGATNSINGFDFSGITKWLILIPLIFK